jgi:hypothetical protein
VLASFLERDPGASHEVAHGSGSEHLSRRCERRHARSDVHRDPGDTSLAPRHLACMEAAPHLESV